MKINKFIKYVIYSLVTVSVAFIILYFTVGSRTWKYYGYQRASCKYDWGEVIGDLDTYGDIETQHGYLAGSPYHLVVTMVPKKPFKNLTINNLKFINLKTQKIIPVKGEIIPNAFLYKNFYNYDFLTENIEFDYDDYNVEFDMFDDGKRIEGVILRFRKDCRKEIYNKYLNNHKMQP